MSRRKTTRPARAKSDAVLVQAQSQVPSRPSRQAKSVALENAVWKDDKKTRKCTTSNVAEQAAVKRSKSERAEKGTDVQKQRHLPPDIDLDQPSDDDDDNNDNVPARTRAPAAVPNAADEESSDASQGSAFEDNGENSDDSDSQADEAIVSDDELLKELRGKQPDRLASILAIEQPHWTTSKQKDTTTPSTLSLRSSNISIHSSLSTASIPPTTMGSDEDNEDDTEPQPALDSDNEEVFYQVPKNRASTGNVSEKARTAPHQPRQSDRSGKQRSWGKRRDVEEPKWKSTGQGKTEIDAATLKKALRNIEARSSQVIGKAEIVQTHTTDSDVAPDLVWPTSGGELSLNAQHSEVQSIVRGAINDVMRYILFVHAFPDKVQRSKISVQALQSASREQHLPRMLQRLSADKAYAADMAALPNQRISTLRGNIKKLTDLQVMTSYGLQQRDELVSDIDWLQKDLQYIYPLDVERRTHKANAPYEHQIFIDILRAQFFAGPSSIASQYSDLFVSTLTDKDSEKEIPGAMMALVSTAIYASLSDWKARDKKARKFSADEYANQYEDNMSVLAGIHQRHPRAYHSTMHRLYVQASGSTMARSSQAKSNILALLDLAGMSEE
ncbi:hypothetical protein OE88DRAFT_1699514 [Heliocybe sulcata]|uniref:DUF6532 domain-containing protein n=1 Tax=Heliocybe sulcata TaxID=5364 RepID=A0A5C3N4Z1_9AGAM|nr:hypothetical protein OE88DRAFT_1699514 [Heliocybe sulcata]